MAREIVGPMSEFQERYVNSDAKIIIAGGAAGSAKSHCGLLRHLRFVEDPYYTGMCVRKNSTAIMKRGGLFWSAVDLYKKVYPTLKVKLKEQTLVFPSGATVSFSHYENDKAADLYQGLELSSVFYDEASQASPEHIWWLISRLRSKAKMSPSIWLTCNPDVDSYLRSWVDWWLYPEHHPKFGLPDPEKNGKIRWLLRVGGDMKWANTAEELIATYGKSHLPVNHEEQVKPLQVQCLLGTIYDNPWLLKNQPEYLATLESLPDLERRRLLLGDWEARQANSTYFQRSWCQEIVSYDPSEFSQVVRSWDFAFTKKSDKNSSPDYTVGTLMGKTKAGEYIVLDVRRMRVTFGEWEKVVYEAWSDDRDKFRDVVTTLPLDPGGGARMSTTLLRRSLAEKGVITKEMRATGKKLERFRSFSAMSETGGVKFLKNCGNDYENKVYNDNGFIYKELEAFDGTRKRGESGHDRFVVVYKPT